MTSYIITDNGIDKIAVYDDNTDTFGHKTQHIYSEDSRRNYSYSEFYKKAFYEDKNSIIIGIEITSANSSTDEMCFLYGKTHESGASIFPANEYYKVEIKRFNLNLNEKNTTHYEETSDIFFVRKRANERLMLGINIRSNNIKSQLSNKLKQVENIKNNINHQNKVSETTKTIIEDYLKNKGEFSNDVLGLITTSEFLREIKNRKKETKKLVLKKWKLTENLRDIGNIVSASGILGTTIASTISSIKEKDLTLNPIILGIGTVFVTHNLFKAIRITLVDSKLQEIEKEFSKDNYNKLTGHSSK